MTDQPGDAASTPPHRYTAELAGGIEARWQQRWAERGTFEVPNPSRSAAAGPDGRGRCYVLDMFPYPSGAGLHVGHPLGYIASDAYARFRRMRGDNVLHPFGFDAFGLPAEQYAIETGRHPAVTTTENIDTMRRQLRRLGLGHDPRRELSTADPRYYRWTQWIFLQLFESWFDNDRQAARPIHELVQELEQGVRSPDAPANPGRKPWTELDPVERRKLVDAHRLAYLDEAPVNWCPGLGTVLANEEVTAEGRSAIGNYPVYRRRMRQWMLRITAYADRLLQDLDALDWTDSLKTQQRNWIGRSEGADIRFAAPAAAGARAEIVVYTTRPDTVFGATCLVLAPEHQLVDELTAPTWPPGTPPAWRDQAATPLQAVDAYRRRAAALSDRQRQAQRAKTAVFTGSFATNPASGEPVPVFVADYVLASYGGGAIMAVPAHDQRDLEFARAFDVPVRAVVRPDRRWLEDHPGAAPDRAETWSEASLDEGVAINSHSGRLSLDGLGRAEATARTIRWLEESGNGRRRVSYRLRDWLFSRQRYWGEPFPIVYDETGLPIALPESLLPVELPPMSDFRPQATEGAEPRPPLSRAPGFEQVTLDLGDGPRTYRRETNVMPQWAGSCWYYLRYLDPANDRRFVDPAVERYWMGHGAGEGQVGGVDLYIGGVEHAVLHLLYARFWHKVLFDLGYVSTPEPFQRLYNQGYILADAFTDPVGRYVPAAEVVGDADGTWRYQGQPVARHAGKMGKSLKNAVSPDAIYEAYGADTLRMYEMAMGPLDVDRPWQPDDIVGVFRFLQRLWRNVVDETTGAVRVSEAGLAGHEPLYRLLHQTIDAVGSQYSELRYNVAIARLIELNNAVTRYAQDRGAAPREAVEPLVLMVAPLAPHIAAELWERLGHDAQVDDVAFPLPDGAALVAMAMVLPVTVDGRRRGEITVSPGATEDEVRQSALALGPVARLVEEDRVARVIHVPGKIVNVVTRSWSPA
jgi:leucyl-tRNA synthetase